MTENFDKEKLIVYWTESSNDDYKRLFYNLCTPQYTTEWIEKIKEYRLWIKTML
jgi:hypothetical protein